MTNDEGYIREKLGNAIGYMATSSDSIQDRLFGAYGSFMTLRAEDFPKDGDRELFTAVVEGLTEVKVSTPRGYVRETLDQMSDERAMEIADKLHQLYTSRMYAAIFGDD